MLLLLLLSILAGLSSTAHGTRSTHKYNLPVSDHFANANERMHKLEDERMFSMLHEYRDSNISVEVFYHVSAWQPHWKEVVLEQLHMLGGRQLVRGNARKYSRSSNNNDPAAYTYMYAPKKSDISVSSIASKINIVLHGDNEQVAAMRLAISGSYVDFLHKVYYTHSPAMSRALYKDSNEEEKKHIRAEAEKHGNTTGEFATINAVHRHCKKQVSGGSNTVVLYMHNKGGCCSKGGALFNKEYKDSAVSIADWRDLMNTVNIEFASICLRAMRNGYTTCGANYQDMHYSGNFWWASCNHVALLPALWDPIDNAWEAEFFLFNVSEAWQDRDPFGLECGYRPFHCRVDHYDKPCPRSKYASVLLPMLASDVMPYIGYHGHDEPSFEEPKRVWKGEPCLSTRTSRDQLSKAIPYYDRPHR
jgi:hypothetical protein